MDYPHTAVIMDADGDVKHGAVPCRYSIASVGVSGSIERIGTQSSVMLVPLGYDIDSSDYVERIERLNGALIAEVLLITGITPRSDHAQVDLSGVQSSPLEPQDNREYLTVGEQRLLVDGHPTYLLP